VLTNRAKILIIRPDIQGADIKEFLESPTDPKILYADPMKIRSLPVKSMYESTSADFVVFRDLGKLQEFHDEGKMKGFYKKIESNDDLKDVLKASSVGADFVIVETKDWRIIPLENVIATLHHSNTQVYAPASSAKDIGMLFSVLELGVDGVILSTGNPTEIRTAMSMMDSSSLNISKLTVEEIRDAGTGERVCIDTVSILAMGEGILVGSKSNFFFLIHNESLGSSFTSPRPFRVNAGAVYCYTMVPGEKTKYLSEIESGSEVLAVRKDGSVRVVTVGRSKIETRPLTLIVARSDGQRGTVILQNAETIQLVKEDGSLIPVTGLKAGDTVLGVIKPSSGRHFGMEVAEYILEK
jgi:3-dehydroquinate synthase II